MASEWLRAFIKESKGSLWFIGLVLATVIIFQCVELPRGDTLWSMFARGGASDRRVFFSENATSDHALTSNMSSPITSNETLVHGIRDGTVKNNYSSTVDEYLDDPFERNTPQLVFPSENHTLETDSSFDEPRKEVYFALPPLQNADFSLGLVDPPVAPPPIALSPTEIPDQSHLQPDSAAPSRSIEAKKSPEKNVLPQSPPFPAQADKAKSEMQQKDVLSLSDMNELLIQSFESPHSMIPRWPTIADGKLITARSQIKNAPPANNGLYAPLYHNASMFQRSYELMEQMLKVYIYQEGDRRIFHRPPLEGIYASEGWFMKLLEANRHFVTKRPEEAHLFYLPFSSRQLEETLYVPNSHSHKNLIRHLKDYLDVISAKYPFWNRTDGKDHFLVACHDWAPSETKRIMASCIRALCNADVKEGFIFGKDVSLPETYVRKAKNPLRDLGGKPPSKRRTLAFYAGNMHGYLRPILLQYWGNSNDPDMQIFGKLPHTKDNRNYINYMKTSRYCICPRGYEVNSPRVVEAIFFECVPVIISDNFVPPFFETLNWESFAVFVAEKDVPNLKNILLAIPEKTYFRMHMRVRKVQQHFLWHPKPVKYDLFHMTLHSIWYNRVFQFRQ